MIIVAAGRFGRKRVQRKTRRGLTAFAVTIAFAVLVAAVSMPFLRRSFLEEASSQAASTLSLAVAALNGHLRRYEALPALIADNDDIQDLLSRPDDPLLRANANHYLRAINRLVKSSDIYVMTADGNTIAASNFDTPTSFVGENFSYRPYFQEAVEGRDARFYALGTTSAKRGYYFSAPVRIYGTIRGVIVFKVDVDQIEASWPRGEIQILVTDPEGIIFMSGNPDWLYAGLKPLTPERLARTRVSRRYSDATLRELPVSETRFRDHLLMTVTDKDKTAREFWRWKNMCRMPAGRCMSSWTLPRPTARCARPASPSCSSCCSPASASSCWCSARQGATNSCLWKSAPRRSWNGGWRSAPPISPA